MKRTGITLLAATAAAVALTVGLSSRAGRFPGGDRPGVPMDAEVATRELNGLLEPYLGLPVDGGLRVERGFRSSAGGRGEGASSFLIAGDAGHVRRFKADLLASERLRTGGWEVDETDDAGQTFGLREPTPRPDWWRPDELDVPDVLTLRRGAGFMFVFPRGGGGRCYVHFWES
ncbi:MAG TPA: hypothetical protein VEA69_01245 [Tepidisphaeraceae bacterium]|nr:hypothetical protein [Tepidisphaeraceae bacterium]